MEFSVAERIQALYRITADLERHYPGRKFTPDGHLVGSIGEVIAAEAYGLTLMKPSFPVHDAKTKDGKPVQIKATQIDKVGISGKPDYLIVLRILPTGDWEEIYSGPGKEPWDQAGKPQKNGQCPISLSRLKDLMKTVPESERIARI